jgi:hypothetical protein
MGRRGFVTYCLTQNRLSEAEEFSGRSRRTLLPERAALTNLLRFVSAAGFSDRRAWRVLAGILRFRSREHLADLG